MKINRITKNIFTIRDKSDKSEKGFATGGIISGRGTILIGCDDRLTPEIISGMGIGEVLTILCCDYRRSANAGVLNFEGADKYINENFYDLLARPELWWEAPENRWHLYKLRPDDDILPYGADNVKKITENDNKNKNEIIIDGVKITVLFTPGDTDYSVSYLVEDEGVKVVFCGGLLYKGGKIPYLYRTTLGIFGQGCEDYHGYLRGISQWKKSLELISAGDVLVPYLGQVIDDPKGDIAEFNKNIDEYYDKYAEISAMNFYFSGLNGGAKKMEYGKMKPFPGYVKSIGSQCNLIISKDKSAFAVDCGGAEAADFMQAMIERGEIKSVDALYISHYHDDHVNGCGYFRERFSCPIYADKIQADIIKNPAAYRLPCISPVFTDVTPLDDGCFWQWREFELTSFNFPGQTLYHGGLMVKNTESGEVVFFAGDSFNPSGIDDYCAYNRNLLTPGEGYFKCIGIIKKHAPDYIINQHVESAFTFTAEQLTYMEKNLTERVRILQKLSPWDDINFLHDEYFVMACPYEQNEKGEKIGVEFLISDYAKDIKCEIIEPAKRAKNKKIYGVRIYAGDMYLGQKACFIVNL